MPVKSKSDSGPSDGKLISPFGGSLVNLVVSDEEREELLARSRRLPSVQISPRALCDLELLATGAFSPLDRFMEKAAFERAQGKRQSDHGPRLRSGKAHWRPAGAAIARPAENPSPV